MYQSQQLGSGTPISAIFTPQVVLLRRSSLTLSLLNPIKSLGELSLNYDSSVTKRDLKLGVTCCTSYHSFWSDIIRPAYAVWGNALANTARRFTLLHKFSTSTPPISPKNTLSTATLSYGFIIVVPWLSLIHNLRTLGITLTVTYLFQERIYLRPPVPKCR